MALPSLDFKTLRDAYARRTVTPSGIVETLIAKLAEQGDDGVWTCKLPADAVLARARKLEVLPDREKAALPLFGLPFTVKDCIDIAGMPTTCACPDFAYTPGRTNLAVQRALDAGAILLGKTNLDQFATGVVGVRSPYGVARNPFDATYIPGGSSSGAAVSVSAGLCAFAFGTDTGGSGRVPASYNNVVGLKPTLGLFSRTDMTNANLSFDTVSVYALTAPDAFKVLETCRAVDPADPYGREAPRFPPSAPEGRSLRIAIPKRGDLEFFGNDEAAALYAAGIRTLAEQGNELIEIDFGVFVETGQMMFGDAWIAERYVAVGDFIAAHPNSVDPVVREVILSSGAYSAVDAFNAKHRLDRNARDIRRTFERADLIAVPTVGTVYKIADIRSDPIHKNATNGRYTNFVNMSDLAAIAVPNGFLANGVPMGITFVGPAFSDAFLASFGERFHRQRVATLGATGAAHPAT